MRRTPYDLVIMDLEMPVMDGWRSTRELRAWERDAPAGVRPQRVCAVVAAAARRRLVPRPAPLLLRQRALVQRSRERLRPALAAEGRAVPAACGQGSEKVQGKFLFSDRGAAAQEAPPGASSSAASKAAAAAKSKAAAGATAAKKMSTRKKKPPPPEIGLYDLPTAPPPTTPQRPSPPPPTPREEAKEPGGH